MTDPRETATAFNDDDDSNEPTTSSTDREIAALVSAAAKARTSLVFVGAEGVGTTTLMRALLGEAP